MRDMHQEKTRKQKKDIFPSSLSLFFHFQKVEVGLCAKQQITRWLEDKYQTEMTPDLLRRYGRNNSKISARREKNGTILPHPPLPKEK